MRLFFDINKKSLPQMVKQNEDDIKTLKEKIKPFYSTNIPLNNDAVTINITDTNIDANKFVDGYLLTQTAKLFDIVSVENGVVYLYFMADFKGVFESNITAFDFVPKENGVNYSDSEMLIDGQLTYSLENSGEISTRTIDATITIPIAGSEDIIVDADEDGNKIEIHLDNDIRTKLAKALITPMSAPSSTEIVAINSANSQINLGIGDGLTIENGTLKASGGSSSGGLKMDLLYDFSSSDSTINKGKTSGVGSGDAILIPDLLKYTFLIGEFAYIENIMREQVVILDLTQFNGKSATISESTSIDYGGIDADFPSTHICSLGYIQGEGNYLNISSLVRTKTNPTPDYNSGKKLVRLRGVY